MQVKRVLVTGGAGFVGHRVVAQLAARGVSVAVVDNLMVGMKMPEASTRVQTYLADIVDPTTMRRIVGEWQPEAVIHLAALHHIPTCEREPYRAMEINVMGTQSVLDAMAASGVKQLVIASSAAVYDWWDAALVEDVTPVKATDVYSTTKIANEHQVAIWAAKTGARVAVARLFNVIGHDDPNGHLIPDILAQVKGGGDIVHLGNTAPRRDYTHADDTAAGVVALLDHLHRGNAVEAYNVASGRNYSVVDMVEAIGDYLGRRLRIVQDPARVRPIDRLQLLGDTSKIRRVTGWAPQRSFEASLTDILTQLRPLPALEGAAG